MQTAPEEIKEYSLTNTDIDRLLGGTKIHAYPELANFRTLDEAMDEDGRMIVLYLTENDSTGHWVCCFKDGNCVQYFDSYGLKPEAPKGWITRKKNMDLGQTRDQFLRLFKAEGKPVFYNKYKYQKDEDDVNTCGRWVTARLLLRDLDDKQFKEVIDDADLKGDDFVSYATYFLLGK